MLDGRLLLPAFPTRLPLFPVPAQSIVAKDGVSGLFTRGLTTRIAANGLQNICFTVLWNLVSKLGHFDNGICTCCMQVMCSTRMCSQC